MQKHEKKMLFVSSKTNAIVHTYTQLENPHLETTQSSAYL